MLHNGNNVDLFHLLKIILDRNLPRHKARREAIKYGEEHATDAAVIMTVAGVTHSRLDYAAFRKGDVNMCTLFEEIAEESRIAGRQEGKIEGKIEGKAEGIIEAGVECGLSKGDILNMLQSKLKISEQKAQEYFDMFGNENGAGNMLV